MGSCPDTDIDPKIVQNLEINCITKIKLPNKKSCKAISEFCSSN